MTAEPKSKSRPGGRTARTKVAVFEAVKSLVAEKGHAAVSMTDVAKRADVAATSLYRRWGDVSALVMDVAVEATHSRPAIARHRDARRRLEGLGSLDRRGLTPARRLIILPGARRNSNAHRSRRRGAHRSVGEKMEQIVAMLDRAATRGEPAPSSEDVLDHLLAPLYVRALLAHRRTKYSPKAW